MSNKDDERIIVVPRKAIFEEDDSRSFQGFLSQKEVLFDAIYYHFYKDASVIRRGDAEHDTNLKQIIPYALLFDADQNKFFTYERLKGGNEARLHNKLSLGVGGHMNRVIVDGIEETDFDQTIKANAQREFNEELVFSEDFVPSLRPIGLINDDKEDVSKVHIGVLYKLVIPSGLEINVRETDMLKGSWKSLEELRDPENFDRLESWSQIAVNAL